MTEAASEAESPGSCPQEDVIAKRLLHRLRCGPIDVGMDSCGFRGIVATRDLEVGEALVVREGESPKKQCQDAANRPRTVVSCRARLEDTSHDAVLPIRRSG